jgi:hypothetical protein
MNSTTSKMSKQRLSDLLEIVQGPSLRKLFEDLMCSMPALPLAPHDLAQFLRLVGYDEICDADVADDDLPFLIAQLQRFQSKSTIELLEILRSLQAQEWLPVRLSPLGPVLEARDSRKEPSPFPYYRVPSFHDPPARKR